MYRHEHGRPLRILIVDDHAIVREGLLRLLVSSGEDWEITEAADGAEALASMRDRPVDVAIVDLNMAGMGGLELIACLRNEFGGPDRFGILVLTMADEEQSVLRCLRAGANGYLTKEAASAESLIEAVRVVAQGGSYLSPSLAERMVKMLCVVGAAGPAAELSPREQEVLDHIVHGGRMTDIAVALGLSLKTVSTHKTRILEKLQLASTAALIRYGLAQDRRSSPEPVTPQPSAARIAIEPPPPHAHTRRIDSGALRPRGVRLCTRA